METITYFLPLSGLAVLAVCTPRAAVHYQRALIHTKETDKYRIDEIVCNTQLGYFHKKYDILCGRCDITVSDFRFHPFHFPPLVRFHLDKKIRLRMAEELRRAIPYIAEAHHPPLQEIYAIKIRIGERDYIFYSRSSERDFLIKYVLHDQSVYRTTNIGGTRAITICHVASVSFLVGVFTNGDVYNITSFVIAPIL